MSEEEEEQGEQSEGEEGGEEDLGLLESESEEEEEKEEDEGNEEKKEREDDVKAAEAEVEETPEISASEQLRKMEERKDLSVSEFVEEHEYVKIIETAATDLANDKEYILTIRQRMRIKDTDPIRIAIELFFANALPFILHRYVQNGYVKVKLKELKRHARWRYDPEGPLDAQGTARNIYAPSDVHNQTFE